MAPIAKRIDVGNGLHLHVRDQGDGEPVVLLHGFPDSSELWDRLTPALLDAGYRVIAPDLRGYGDSDAPVGTANYGLRLLADDILSVMDALGVKRAKLVGHDWGAALGWLLAGAHPDRFERYCAISVGHPRAYLQGGLSQKLRAWYILLFQPPGLVETLLRAGDWALWRRMPGKLAKQQLALLRRPGRLEAALSIYRANFFPQMRKLHMPSLTIPVLGVWSSGDAFLSEGQMLDSQRFAQAGFRYQRIEGVNHWIPAIAPKALAAVLLPFLAEAS